MGTLLAVIALLTAMAAFGFAWKLQRELDTARRRLDRYNKALFEAGDRIVVLEDRLEATTATLRVYQRQLAGQELLSPDMTVGEVTRLHPQAAQILAGFHLGGCSSCAVDDDDTLVRICADNNVDLATLLGALNQLLVPSANGNGRDIKLPNVAVEF